MIKYKKMKIHNYSLTNTWTGNYGAGTTSYKSYERAYTIAVKGKPDLLGTSDPAFRGDIEKHNPEELFLASISGCHMLWFLHLCSVSGVNVVSYKDEATGKMEENKDGSGKFTEVLLQPAVIVADIAMIEKANELHAEANKKCFIANSCNFPIRHQPNTSVSIH